MVARSVTATISKANGASSLRGKLNLNHADNEKPRSLLGQYVHEIAQIPLLTWEQEQYLGTRIQEGIQIVKKNINKEKNDLRLTEEEMNTLNPAQKKQLRQAKESHDIMWGSSLLLVVYVARKSKYFLPLQSRISSGNLGLEHAVNKYDPTRGTKFSTYATYWIRQAIKTGWMDENSTVIVPHWVYEQMAAFIPRYSERCSEHGKMLPWEALGKDLPRRHIKAFQKAARFTSEGLSCDIDSGKDNNAVEPMDLDAENPFDLAAFSDLYWKLVGLVELLGPEDRKYIEIFFGLKNREPKTTGQVAKILDITKERAKSLRKRSLNHLKLVAKRENSQLLDYLG